MQKKFYIFINTLVKCTLFLACLYCFPLRLAAQSYTGYQSGAYSGVYSILNNPADILSHRVRGDFNLAGVSTALGNNVFTFKYKKINGNGENDPFAFGNPIKKAAKLNFNTDVFGPSLLIRLSDKHAFALSTRARVLANLYGLDKEILNALFQNTIESSFINNTVTAKDMSVQIHAFKEIALTYSRQITNSDYGVWKAGVSLKYLSGMGAFSFTTKNLSFTYDSIIDPVNLNKTDAIIKSGGSIAIGYTKNFDSLSGDVTDYLRFTNPGFGADIGVSYEHRGEMQVYETSYSDKANNYIWKVGAAITDLGFIRYAKSQTKGLITRFGSKPFLINQLSAPSDSSDLFQKANYYAGVFGPRIEPSAITMQLPTTLRLSFDRYFNPWLGVQAQLNIPLMFTRVSIHEGNYNPVSVVITPRAEVPAAGIYLPLSYNSISGFQMGAALRLGPLVIGSASLINTRILGSTKGADAYFILRIPLFGYREYKEKAYFETHPKLSRRQRKRLDCSGN
jgi:Family of unknown function (DUF5723)